MKQAYLADAVAAVPASTGAASVGNPSDGDPANNVQATALGAYAMYQIFKEIENVITDAGLTPDVDVLTQLRDAIDRQGRRLDRAGHDARRCALSAPATKPRRSRQRRQRAKQPERLQPGGGQLGDYHAASRQWTRRLPPWWTLPDTPQELDTVLNAAKANGGARTFTDANFSTTPPTGDAIRRASRRPRGYRVFSPAPAVGSSLTAGTHAYGWESDTARTG